MNRPKIDVHAPLSEFPTAGKAFRTSWPVRTGDIHTDRSLRLDGIARYLQDAGFDHLVAEGAMDTHPAWVVRRTVIDVVEPITWPDQVHLQRWCSGLSAKWCSMRVRIQSDGGGLVETEAFWINLDSNTGMPATIGENFTAAMASTASDHHLHWRRWIDPEVTEFESTPFPLRASDFDPFDHVNNAIYWQPVDEAVGKQLGSKSFRSILEYSRPVTRGEEVTVRSDEAAGRLHFDVDDHVCASARWFSIPPAAAAQG